MPYLTMNEALKTPLLLDEEVVERDGACRQIQSADDEQESSCCSDSVLRCILYMLMVLQFGQAFYVKHDLALTTTTSFGMVLLSVLLFALTARLYRFSARDVHVTSPAVVLLLPEIIVNIILCLILVDQSTMAFALLLTSMFVLSIFVVVVSATSLWCGQQQHVDDDDDMEAASQQTLNLTTCHIV